MRPTFRAGGSSCPMARQRVLFLCPDNAARSPMAEGLLRALADTRFEVQSAGPERRETHPLAIRVMDERGIDISGHAPKLMLGFLPERWDYVIALYDPATERRPLFSGRAQQLDWPCPDPSRQTGTDTDRLHLFRSIRDNIAGRISEWLAAQGA